jgi:N-acetylmuramoyl-L-alanine amidase
MNRKLTPGAMIPVYLAVCAAILALTSVGNRAVTVIAMSAPLPDRHSIIIDAGHGDPDGGAVSCTGVFESCINLQISRRLCDLFRFLGYDTQLTRETDSSVYTQGNTIGEKKISDLKERVRIVNETENAILISIHQNTFSDSRYGGAQVFYGPKGESKQLANLLQSTLVQTINTGSNRKSKPADGVYLMEHIEKTGVLIECGFLSNPEECSQLCDDSYQRKIAYMIYLSLLDFYSEPYSVIISTERSEGVLTHGESKNILCLY